MKHTINIIVAILFSCFLSCTAQDKTQLDVNEFEKGITSGEKIQLLDVRTPGEYQSGHIKNALLANWNDAKEFDRRISFMEKNTPVYIYCLSGGRSRAAADKMRSLGFNVLELRGGINAWKAATKPVEGQSAATRMTLEMFNGAITSSKIVLVDVGATWCPPCKKMEPVIKSLQENNPGKFLLVNVDGGNDEEVLKHFNITELPVFIIFKDGRQTWRRDGIATEAELSKELF